MPGSKPGERRGGRQKGTPNKATADIKAALRMHGQEMVEELLRLTTNADPRVRLGALAIALDRGYGKAVQHLEAEVSVYDGLGLAEQQVLLAALDELDLAEASLGEPMELAALSAPAKPSNGADE